MTDILIATTEKTLASPVCSKERQRQEKALRVLIVTRQAEIAKAEDLLNRQWAWMDANGERDAVMLKFGAALADYEDLCDGLRTAKAVLA